ncbi:UDP-N-acetylmuramoyl-L-alanine--D-glutamate ligase [Acetohalobium arabaticum]|uniref:UDP-N-acetylmuramoylalanine--D-glutamate ligase n=1 Tax=Acetohalobium arabaticum (strain ATCC 49924 / DSM 5501 / Z-7288) TaxID=574087 RepID=D9QVM5_ACEAZ|nr:UDP-N-acetylmuramoyl-L-alanine--D-glutamate ligase [Acetohalobium arabaticum]ADL12284.1 UDP-N-acetylmuramoylalanine/D-glutamate ligase [Acetohalobium arabaticum DSM 5501]
MNLADKKVVVIGLGKRTGVAAAEFLVKQKAEVVVSDIKSADELQNELGELADYEIDFDLGGHSSKVTDNTDLIVVSPGVPSDIPILEKAQSLGIPVISEIELAYHFCSAPIMAITGTNGKTTTTTLTGEIFTVAQEEVKIRGNIGYPLIEDITSLTDKGVVVAEISSFQLENIRDFRPKISLILNLTPDHLNRHGTFEDYIAAKKKIFINQTESDYTVLNYDDELTRGLADETGGEVIYFSQQSRLNHGIYAAEGKIINNLTADNEPLIQIDETGIKGPHNLENALGAVVIALLRGIDVKIIRKVLQEFSGIEHRIEEVATIEGIKYINDSKATNPAAAIKALETFSAPITLIAGGMDKKAELTDFAFKIEENVQNLILLGETAEKIEESVTEFRFSNIKQVDSISEAVKEAEEVSVKGSIVLLAPGCASWDMFGSYKERGNRFKKEVMELRRK